MEDPTNQAGYPASSKVNNNNTEEIKKDDKNMYFMNELQSFGLETVIVEQNTNSDGLSDDQK